MRLGAVQRYLRRLSKAQRRPTYSSLTAEHLVPPALQPSEALTGAEMRWHMPAYLPSTPAESSVRTGRATRLDGMRRRLYRVWIQSMSGAWDSSSATEL